MRNPSFNAMRPWLAGVVFLAALATAMPAFGATIIDHTCTDLNMIPATWLDAAKANLHVVYQHTSHGSQLITGMNALQNYDEFGDTYDWDDSGSRAGALDLDDDGIPGCADLSQGDSIDENGVTPWVTATRALLDQAENNPVNVVIWSWCSINGHDIDRYLTNLEILIAEYGPGGSKPRVAAHPVSFVFMTGHTEGQGEDGFIHSANEQIRAHCREHDRILFDFADIESYDPDGTYYLDLAMYDNLDYTPAAGGESNWGQEWCQANQGSELALLTQGCSGCAHSSDPAEANLNCVLKGRAAWWMMARLAGWTPDSSGNQAPVLNHIGSKNVVAGKVLEFALTGSDPDENPVSCEVTGLPAGASFDADTMTFNWRPGISDVGTYSLTFTLCDNGSPVLRDTETITITVTESDSPPNQNSNSGSSSQGCFISALMKLKPVGQAD